MFALSFGVSLAYILSILSTLVCVVYGIKNWNKGSEQIDPEDIKWVSDEAKIEEDL